MSFVDPDSNLAMIRHGVKTGIAAVLAYGIAHLFHLEFGYWAALSAVIVMQVNVADSIRMCLYRFSGTAVGAVMGMVAILIFPETPVMTMLALFCSAGFCAYMTRYNVRYRMAAITVCIVLLASLGEDNRLVFGMFRVIEIGVGVVAAFVVSILLWPVRAGTALKARLRARFNDCAQSYDALMEAFLSLQVEVDAHLLDRLQADILEDRILYQKVLHHERWMYGEDTDLLGLKVRTLEKCCAHLQTMLHALNSGQGIGYEILMKSELHELTSLTVDGMRRINSGQIPQVDRLERALEQAESRLLELREGGATRRFHLQKLVQFFSFYHGAQSLGQDICLYGQDPLFTASQDLAEGAAE